MLRFIILFSATFLATPAFAERLAVLDFTSVKSERELLGVMAEMVRNEAVNQLTDSGVKVMDQANILALLQDQGKDASCLGGECEIEIGRNIGADYVVTGQLTVLGEDWILNLSLYETESGSKLKGQTIEAASSKALRQRLTKDTAVLLKPLDRTPEKEPAKAATPDSSGDALMGPQKGDFRPVHWSSLKVKKQVRPSFPRQAREMNLSKADCVVDFWIDEFGVPQRVGVSACEPVFHAATESACMKWRFQPVKDKSGRAITAFFKLRVGYTAQ